MNAILCADNDAAMFVTFFLAIIDIRTGVVSFSNAGHNLPYMIRHQQDVEETATLHGPPLGVVASTVYETGLAQQKPDKNTERGGVADRAGRVEEGQTYM